MPKPVLRPMLWKDTPEELRGYNFLDYSPLHDNFYIYANGRSWDMRWSLPEVERLILAKNGSPLTGCPYATPQHNAYYSPCGSKGTPSSPCHAHSNLVSSYQIHPKPPPTHIRLRKWLAKKIAP